jgi:hypothetical protein
MITGLAASNATSGVAANLRDRASTGSARQQGKTKIRFKNANTV